MTIKKAKRPPVKDKLRLLQIDERRSGILIFLIFSFYHLSAQLDSISNQGTYRTFILHLPSGYDESEDYPLVFNLHGHGSNAFEQQAYSQFDNISDNKNFIAVYPNAINGNWELAGAFDTDFLSSLVDTIRQRYSTNACLFFMGMSQGGFMSYKLACELPQYIAAIAVVTGNMTIPLQASCNNPRTVSVMHFHGTDDAVVPYEGSFGVPPVEEAVQWWAEENECNPSPVITGMEDIDPDDDSTVERHSYTDCESGSEVILFKVIGGGHTWPGAIPLPPLGVTNQDIDASELIGEFFSSHCSQISGIDEFNNNAGIGIYPNPFNDMLVTELPGQAFDVALLGTDGRVLFEKKDCYNKTSLNTSDLWPGIYFMQITTGGKETFSRIVIHQ